MTFVDLMHIFERKVVELASLVIAELQEEDLTGARLLLPHELVV